MAVNLDSLSVYVDQNKLDLIRKTVLGPKTIGYLNLQTGVKGNTRINLLETTVTFGDGASCGFTDNANTKLSQREIVPASVKINATFCDKKMQRYFMNHQVTVAAGRSTLPFEEHFVNSLVESTGVELEKAIWNGVEIGGTHFNGFLDFAAEYTTVSKATEPSAQETTYEMIRKGYNAIPSTSLADTVIFLGIDKYRELAGELTAKNLYHYDPKVDEAFEMILPGTTTKVVGVPGLDGTGYALALNVKHAFYGTDMEGDEEVFDLWYSKDNQEWRAAINFVFGVQVAFPNENVIIKF